MHAMVQFMQYILENNMHSDADACVNVHHNITNNVINYTSKLTLY
jgi:hypothetical protein